MSEVVNNGSFSPPVLLLVKPIDLLDAMQVGIQLHLALSQLGMTWNWKG